jgi:acyl-CoA thioester hydrolase
VSPRRKRDDDAPAAAPRKRAGGRSKQAQATTVAPATPPGPLDAVLIRMSTQVRWRDLDAFSHVNNSSFLTYVEEARLQWFQSLPGPWLSEDIAPVLAATHVNYRRPIEWPEELVVELRAERVGTTSLTLAHRILAARDASVLYSDGHSVLVWISRRDGKPAALPDAVRAACSA